MLFMSQQYGGLPPLTPPLPTPPATPAGLTWSDTFIRALTQPSEETYQTIASDTPVGSNSKAYTWIFTAAVISQLIAIVGSFLFFRTPTFSSTNPEFAQQVQSSALLINLICAPVVGLLSILGFAISVGITQWI